MGSSNPIRKIAKPISKIIPKEIRPALPFVLPFVPVVGPALSKMTTFSSLGKLAPLVSKGILSAGTKAITDPEANIGDILRTGAVSVAPDVLSQGLGSLEQAGKLPEFMTKVGKGKDAVSAVQKIQSTLKPESLLGKAGLVTAQTGIAEAPKLARLQREEIEKYNQQLQDQGIRDKASRRKSIFDIYVGAGYDAEYVNSVLDKYGYAEGGRVGYQRGGITLEELLGNTPVYENMGGTTRPNDIDISQFKPIEEIKEEELTQKDLLKDLAKEIRRGRRSDFDAGEGIKGLQAIVDAYEMSTGQPMFQRPQPMGIIPGFGN